VQGVIVETLNSLADCRVSSIRFSRCGSLFVVGLASGNIALWSTSPLREVMRYSPESTRGERLQCEIKDTDLGVDESCGGVRICFTAEDGGCYVTEMVPKKVGTDVKEYRVEASVQLSKPKVVANAAAKHCRCACAPDGVRDTIGQIHEFVPGRRV
jgi:hypothetical protein